MWFLCHILNRFEMNESDSVNFWQRNWGTVHSSHPPEPLISFANGTKMQRMPGHLFIRSSWTGDTGSSCHWNRRGMMVQDLRAWKCAVLLLSLAFLPSRKGKIWGKASSIVLRTSGSWHE
jgi:hypothetical protein